MSDMLETLAILAFFGAAGLVLGVIAGLRLDRRARMAGMLLGLAAGIALSIEILREVSASDSSTAAIGLLFVPFPPVFNAASGYVAAWLTRSLRLRRRATLPTGE